MKYFSKISIYLAFTKAYLKSIFAYKASVIMGLIGRIIMVSVTFFLWKAIYNSSATSIIKGFTISQMLTYVMISFLVSQTVFVDTSHQIGNEVKDGSIAMTLIKPINFYIIQLFRAFGDLIFNFSFLLFPGLIVVTVYGLNVGIDISFFSIVIFIFSIVLGALINFHYSYLFGLLAFKLNNIWGIQQLSRSIIMLLSGSLIPLTFFPDIIQKIFSLLPFSSIIYVPSMIFVNKYSISQILGALLMQIFWIIVLFLISKIFWKKAINTLSIQGG